MRFLGSRFILVVPLIMNINPVMTYVRKMVKDDTC